MAITFAVDEVTPAGAPAPTVALGELVGAHLVLGLPADLPVLPGQRVHPLLAAVQRAFDEHRPLVLSPDAIWLTITGGLAQHLRLHAETLRPRLVRHDGRKQLKIELLAAPVTAADWADAIDGWCRAIADEPGAGAGLARLCACDFSTSGPAERVAAQVVLMDAMSPYYVYVGGVVCGIPAITLTGAPADWRAIRARLDVLAELDLAWWTGSLAAIVDRLIAAAEGRPDRGFFQAIYKPAAAYGSDRIAGWVARLYPYLRGDGHAFTVRNPLLAFGLDEPLPGRLDAHGYYQGPAITSEDAGYARSRAIVVLRREGTGASTALQLEGGLLAVEQDPAGRLVPRAGWLVRPEGTGADAVLEQIRAAHHGVPADAPIDDAPAGCHPLFEAFREAFLFEGARRWHVRGVDGWDVIELARGQYLPVQVRRVVDLPDGTTLAVLEGAPSAVIRLPADPAEVPWTSLAVVGDALIDVLGEAMRRGGALPVSDGRTLLDVVPDAWDGWSHATPLLARLRATGQEVGPEPDQEVAWDLERGLAGRTFALGPWRARFRARDERGEVRLASVGRIVRTVADLGDGTALARLDLDETPAFVHLRVDALREELVPRPRGRRAVRVIVNDQPREQLRLLGRSLVEILTYVLDHGALPPGAPWPSDR